MRRSRFILGFMAIAGLSLGWTQGASALTIDFEGFSNGQILSTTGGGAGTHSFGSLDVTFSGLEGDNGSGRVVVFDTSNGNNGSDPDLHSPFSQDAYTIGPVNPGNALIIQDDTNLSTCGGGFCADPDDEVDGQFILDFSHGVQLSSIDVLDIGEATLDLFFANALLASIDVPGVGGSGNGEDDNKSGTFVLDNQFANLVIDRFVFSLGNSGAIDNIVVSTVPVPAALPLLGAALAAIGFAARRRRVTAS